MKNLFFSLNLSSGLLAILNEIFAKKIRKLQSSILQNQNKFQTPKKFYKGKISSGEIHEN